MGIRDKGSPCRTGPFALQPVKPDFDDDHAPGPGSGIDAPGNKQARQAAAGSKRELFPFPIRQRAREIGAKPIVFIEETVGLPPVAGGDGGSIGVQQINDRRIQGGGKAGQPLVEPIRRRCGWSVEQRRNVGVRRQGGRHEAELVNLSLVTCGREAGDIDQAVLFPGDCPRVGKPVGDPDGGRCDQKQQDRQRDVARAGSLQFAMSVHHASTIGGIPHNERNFVRNSAQLSSVRIS